MQLPSHIVSLEAALAGLPTWLQSVHAQACHAFHDAVIALVRQDLPLEHVVLHPAPAAGLCARAYIPGDPLAPDLLLHEKIEQAHQALTLAMDPLANPFIIQAVEALNQHHWRAAPAEEALLASWHTAVHPCFPAACGRQLPTAPPPWLHPSAAAPSGVGMANQGMRLARLLAETCLLELLALPTHADPWPWHLAIETGLDHEGWRVCCEPGLGTERPRLDALDVLRVLRRYDTAWHPCLKVFLLGVIDALNAQGGEAKYLWTSGCDILDILPGQRACDWWVEVERHALTSHLTPAREDDSGRRRI